MFGAVLAAIWVSQGVAGGSLDIFERACLDTVGDPSAFSRFAEDNGWRRRPDEAPMFPGAVSSIVFDSDEATIRLESFPAVREWVDDPLAPVEDLTRALRRQEQRNPVRKVLVEGPASATCMVDSDQGDADLAAELLDLSIDGRPLRSYPVEPRFQTHKWQISGPVLDNIQYLRADESRDDSGTRSTLFAQFRFDEPRAR